MEKQHTRAVWFGGGDPDSQNCAPLPRRGKAYRLVLLGPPGVGKGTQAEMLSRALGACHLSTGDVFRAAKSLSQRSPSLSTALEAMQRGELVSDQTVVEMIGERIACLSCLGGFLLDGFPRTVAQAQTLDKLLEESKVNLDAVLNFDLPLEDVVARLSGRRTCAGCKAVYHTTSRPPKVAGVCDICGETLIQREDDRPESARVRMEAYEKSTKPLADYYAQRGLLVDVAAQGTPEAILERALAALKVRGTGQ